MTDTTPEGISDVVLTSLITCPGCGRQQTETMPEFSCAIVYQCPGCGAMLRPAAGDCCVYCTYGTVPCPAVQRQQRADLRNIGRAP